MLCDKSGQIIYTKTESDEQNVMEFFFKKLDYVEKKFNSASKTQGKN